MELITVLQQVAILFILFVVGFIVRKIGIFDQLTTNKMSRFLMLVSLPALILVSMQREFSASLINESLVILAVSIGIYVLYILIALVLGLFLKTEDTGIYQFAIVFTNVGFMGFPVLNAVFGPEAVFFAAICNIPFHFLAYTVGAVFVTRGHHSEVKLKPSLFVTPAVIATILGFSFFLFSIKLPVMIAQPIEMIGSITTPLSMLLIGSMLAENPIREALGKPSDYIIVVLRLLVLPLGLFFILRTFISSGLMLYVPVIIAAMPVAAAASILAGSYNCNTRKASNIVFLTTVFSVITIPLVIYIIM